MASPLVDESGGANQICSRWPHSVRRDGAARLVAGTVSRCDLMLHGPTGRLFAPGSAVITCDRWNRRTRTPPGLGGRCICPALVALAARLAGFDNVDPLLRGQPHGQAGVGPSSTGNNKMRNETYHNQLLHGIPITKTIPCHPVADPSSTGENVQLAAYAGHG